MPPSPAMRCSPGRELRAENHKRGRSLESGIILRDRDEDLALFNEVRSRERDNFLLQSNDDFEDSFSTKLRYFSDNKIGVSIPARGESSDLLNVEGDKNDYDWLLTPPDTPLFPSLDDDSIPVNLAPRGRPRTQPISISRSSTMEKSHRSSRGSDSPNRLSPSPRSGNSTFQSRGRASSPAPGSSPTPTLRPATPSRRPSSPSSKSLITAPRTSTPTPRRLSTSSSVTTRGTSPVMTSRGNSASPKVRAWQSNIPGFSSEAPPNLRTSLADRPASYVRGSSPASRNGRDSSFKSGRQSMSPTASRSVSSSHSQDRDRFSSQSKGSIASSGDDDLESLPSVTVGSLDRGASRRAGALSNNKASSLSKKPSRSVSSNSAPKRSFDLALRQMEQRKGPPNMFRPLLSSVPSSTFYAGKASAAHRAMISRNSSVTTSSNASSDLGTSRAHDYEASDQNQDYVSSEHVKEPDHDVEEEELFVFDRADTSNEDLGQELHSRPQRSQPDDLNGSRTFNISDHDIALTIPAASDYLDTDGHEDMLLCLKCGCKYPAIESIEEEVKLCSECRKLHSLFTLTSTTPVTASVVSERMSTVIVKEHESADEMEPLTFAEFQELTSTSGSGSGQHEDIVREGQNSYSESIWNFLPEEGEHRHANQQVTGQPPSVIYSVPGSEAGSELVRSGDFPNLKIGVSDGAGISILLKRSSSIKGHVVQSRNFSASSISFDDLSYVRDSTNSMRSSMGPGSMSASSSVDLGRVQRQSSSRKSDTENIYRFDPNAKHQRSGSSLSGNSSQAFHPSSLGTSTLDLFEPPVVHVGKDAADMSCVAPQEQLLTSRFTELDDTVELPGHTHIVSGRNSVASFSNFEESASCAEDSKNNIWDGEAASAMNSANTDVGEVVLPNSYVDVTDVAEIPSQSSLDTISEIEIENTSEHSPDSQYDVVSTSSKSSIDESKEPPLPAVPDDDIAVTADEYGTSDRALDILEESTVTVKGKGGIKARSLTLDEATDTILFCSSIVHNLAYEAATLAMEKETHAPSEASWQLIPATGKSDTDRSDPRSKNVSKRASKSQRARQRKVETDLKPPSGTKYDEKSDLSTTRLVGVPNNVESMKPPKLESKCNCTIM